MPGERGYRDGFIDHYLVKVIYRPGLTAGMQIGLGLLVLLTAIIGYPGFLRRHPRGHGVAETLADEHLAGAQSQPWTPAGRAVVAGETRRTQISQLGANRRQWCHSPATAHSDSSIRRYLRAARVQG